MLSNHASVYLSPGSNTCQIQLDVPVQWNQLNLFQKSKLQAKSNPPQTCKYLKYEFDPGLFDLPKPQEWID